MAQLQRPGRQTIGPNGNRIELRIGSVAFYPTAYLPGFELCSQHFTRRERAGVSNYFAGLIVQGDRVPAREHLLGSQQTELRFGTFQAGLRFP